MSIYDSQAVQPIIKTNEETKLTAGARQSFREIEVGASNTIIFMDSQGARFGGKTFEDAKAWIKTDGSFLFKTAAGETVMDSSGIVNVINSALNTQTKRILAEFKFQDSGALAINTDANNGIWLSPNGILAKNGGNTTFALDTLGNATFSGAIVSSSITSGTIVGANISSSSSAGRITLTNGDRLYFYDGAGNIQGTMYGDANDMRISAADDIMFGSGFADRLKLGQNYLMPMVDLAYYLGNSTHRYHSVYAQHYNTDAGNGTDTDFTVITDIDQRRTDGVVTSVWVKRQTITISGGVVIGVSAKSEWIEAS